MLIHNFQLDNVIIVDTRKRKRRRDAMTGYILQHDGLLKITTEEKLDGKTHKCRMRLGYMNKSSKM